MKSYSDELFFALEVCKNAGAIAMNYLEKGFDVANKSDGTEVTKADKECEAYIRDRISKAYPGDSLLGEEEGESAAITNGRQWIIDPIDGTSNYAKHMPIFATLLALEEDGEIVLGVVHAPAMAETYWAARGQGAFKNGMAISVSKIDSLSKGQVNYGEIKRLLSMGYWEGFTKIISNARRTRGFGDYLSFGTVFEGKADATIELGVKVWDLAPMKIIVEEAGGRFSDLSGGTSVREGSCVISNGLIHDEVLTMLKSSKAAIR